jgi:hypothetical protein
MASCQVLASSIAVIESSMVASFRMQTMWYEKAGLRTMYLHVNGGFLGNSDRDTTSFKFTVGPKK